MNESEFRSRLYKLFDNDYIYNNPLSDELDVIIKQLVENNYKINRLIYRELLRCFTIKQSLLKLGINPIVEFTRIINTDTGGFFYKDGEEYVIFLNYNHIDKRNILLDMEKILHEIEHMAQSLCGHNEPSFHFMIKDFLLSNYFGDKYYRKNYSGILYEMDAFQTAREEIYEYVENNIPSVFEDFKKFEETKNNLNFYIYPDEYASYRVIGKEFNNYQEYKNNYDIDQIFDKVMLDVSSSKKEYLVPDTLFDINQMDISLRMQYDEEGKYRKILDFIKNKNKYQKELDKLLEYDEEKNTEEDDEETLNRKYFIDYFKDLIEVYDSFIYSRSYSANHLARELLSFSKYQGKDIKVIEEMYIVVEMFTDLILNSGVAFEQNNKRIIVNDEDLDYIDFCIKQIHNNNTFILSDDEYFMKLKTDIYKNSILLLDILKQDMLSKKTYTKTKKKIK